MTARTVSAALHAIVASSAHLGVGPGSRAGGVVHTAPVLGATGGLGGTPRPALTSARL